jgi:signal transduction histidine kinase
MHNAKKSRENLLIFKRDTGGPTPKRPRRRPSLALDDAPMVDWTPMDGPEHGVLFYEDDAFLLDSLSGYIGPVLAAGQPAVIVATPEHRAGAEARLASRGIDVSAARQDRMYRAFDARDVLDGFMVDAVPRADAFGTLLDEMLDGVTRDRPARIFGEMVGVLAADGLPDAALVLEELWNRELETRPFSLLCGYPIATFAGEALAPALEATCQAHGAVVPSESYSALRTREDRLREITLLQQKAQSLEAALASERQAREATERALHVRDEFLSSAAHELRTPITVIGIQAQSALRRWQRTGEIESERAVHALRTIESQTNKLARLVNQLLDVSRLDSGNLVVEPQTLDLAALVRHVVDVTRELSELHPISASAPEHLVAQVDPLRIEQVLMSLFDNAIKNSPEGSPIEVSLAHVDAHYVEIGVRDHGPGIDPDERDHIFDRFYQAKGEHTRWGVGLGLYLCRHILELHGGELTATWPADGGTHFTLHLPA